MEAFWGNFWTVAQQVGILFALVAGGFVCGKTKLIDEKSVRGIVNILILVVTPCLIINVFQRPFDRSMLSGLGLAFAISLAIHAVAIGIAMLCFRKEPLGSKCVLATSTVFSNAGFMGIPLEQAILGDGGVFFGIVYVVVFNMMFWSWGYAMMRGEFKFNRMILVNPGTIGIAIGLPMFLCSYRLPAVLHAPVSMLADLNTPLAMLVIGYYLYGARLGGVAKAPSAYGAALLRLLAVPLLAVAAMYPLRGVLCRDLVLALVIASSAPVAAMVAMFAVKFGRDVDMGVGMVSATTLLSVATMPFVVAVAMHFF